MKIGLLGFGVVGRGVYELTRSRDDMQVVKVLRREDMQLPDAKTVRDIRDIVEDDSIDTVVEVMGGLHPAYDYVRAAIEAGKNVVTANKAMTSCCRWCRKRASASAAQQPWAAASAGFPSWNAPAGYRASGRSAAS